MKKFLLSVFGLFSLLSSFKGNSQTITTAVDTLFINASLITNVSVYEYHNDITNTTPQNIDINWYVSYNDFPSDWKANMGICDASICYNNPVTGARHQSINQAYLANSTQRFDMQLSNFTSVTSSGTHYLTVHLKDTTNTSGSAKDITFAVTRYPASVSTTTKADDNVTLYPNPARNELNVLFNPDADVRIITVYNLIGKAVTVYKLTSNSSAKLDIENLPSGVYFMRLIDGAGQVVATRKFNHQ